MSDETDALYIALAAGEGSAPQDPRVLGELRQRVFAAQLTDDEDARREALEVSGALIGAGGLDWVGRFADDVSVAIRARALDIGLAAGPEGLPVVRVFTADSDADVSLAAIARLTETGDKAATPRIRGLLGATAPAVRAAAAHYVGLLAGPVVRPQLAKLAESDPDEIVRATAQVALERVLGARERGPLVAWSAEAAVSAGPRPEEAIADPAPGQVPLPAGPPPSDAPAARVGDELPSQLPPGPDALVRLLGAAAPGDRQAVLLALKALDAREVGAVVGAYRAGGDAVMGRGAALAARHLGLSSSITDLRRWLADPSADVRRLSVKALGDLGGPAVLPTIAAVLRDADSSVRVAAVGAVADAAKRLDVAHMARTWLTPAAHGPDAEVAAAARAALDGLS